MKSKINHLHIASLLQKNSIVFQQLLSDCQENEYKWKPKPEKWCTLEILCHLIDEEKEDFRMRVKTTLESPGQLPPPIDPVGWVKDRNYIGQNFTEKLAEFSTEREKSLAWLQSIKSPNWENSYMHESLGELSAGLFLNNWLAHDYMHIRQILNTKFLYLQTTSGEELSYAGKW